MAEKTVLVTGGSRGIGYSTAELFHRNGANVMLCSRSETDAKSAADKIATATGGKSRVIGLACDVAVEAEVRSMFETGYREFGPIDVLINNAAVFTRAPLTRLDSADWERTMRANVTGPFLCAREFFRKTESDRAQGLNAVRFIVNIGSLSGVPGVTKFPGFAAYNVSKYGISGLSEILAVEGAQLNIRVNTINPGAVDTPMLQQALPDLQPRLAPGDIAKLIYFLCADGEFISGASIEVRAELLGKK